MSQLLSLAFKNGIAFAFYLFMQKTKGFMLLILILMNGCSDLLVDPIIAKLSLPEEERNEEFANMKKLLVCILGLGSINAFAEIFTTSPRIRPKFTRRSYLRWVCRRSQVK